VITGIVQFGPSCTIQKQQPIGVVGLVIIIIHLHVAIIAKAQTFGFTMSKMQRVSENLSISCRFASIVPLGTMLLVSS